MQWGRMTRSVTAKACRRPRLLSTMALLLHRLLSTPTWCHPHLLATAARLCCLTSAMASLLHRLPSTATRCQPHLVSTMTRVLLPTATERCLCSLRSSAHRGSNCRCSRLLRAIWGTALRIPWTGCANWSTPMTWSTKLEVSQRKAALRSWTLGFGLAVEAGQRSPNTLSMLRSLRRFGGNGGYLFSRNGAAHHARCRGCMAEVGSRC